MAARLPLQTDVPESRQLSDRRGTVTAGTVGETTALARLMDRSVCATMIVTCTTSSDEPEVAK